MFEPKPKMLFPAPEWQDEDNEGEAPLAGEKGSVKEKKAVPFMAFIEDFSSMPFVSPSPVGNEIEGTSTTFDLVLSPSVVNNPGNLDVELFCEDPDEL